MRKVNEVDRKKNICTMRLDDGTCSWLDTYCRKVRKTRSAVIRDALSRVKDNCYDGK